MEYFKYSENSILITFNNQNGSSLISLITKAKNKIENAFTDSIIEIIQSINSILVIYNTNEILEEDLKKILKNIESEKIEKKTLSKIWEIPICYDPIYAKDIEEFSIVKKIPLEKLIEIHKSKIYDVISMGFLPGFMYLGYTDKILHCERKKKPSLNVDKGSIGLALDQTCIYPQKSPGGWHIIGSSPITFFQNNSQSPCFAKPGDKISFFQITINEYENIKNRKNFKPKFS